MNTGSGLLPILFFDHSPEQWLLCCQGTSPWLAAAGMFSGAGFQDILTITYLFLDDCDNRGSRPKMHDTSKGNGDSTLAIDVRMLRSSGIGRYIRNTVPLVVDSLRGVPITCLGRQSDNLSLQQQASAARFRFFEPSIYSIREQVEFSSLRNSFSLFWSPHYNVPLAHQGKLLVTIHDLNHLHIRAAHKRLYAELMFRAVKRKASMVLINSEFTANEVMSRIGLAKEKIVVTPLGVDDFWRRSDSSEPPHPKPYLLCVGNVKPHKNLARLMRAFKLLADRIPHDLVIVGKTEGFITADKGAQQSAKELGSRVCFAGEANDVELKRYYSHATALVFPSLYEGFGLPPLEAMACGCPVAVSRAAALPEVCGDAALYFDPYDVPDMAFKVKQLIDDGSLRDDLRARGIVRSQTFRWERCAARTSEVIKDLLSN